MAHAQVTEFLCSLPQFDEVWMVPVFDHPFEKNLIDFERRVKWCQWTIEALSPKAQVTSIEGELKNRPSYTIKTVEALIQKYPNSQFTVVVGSDCRESLKQWYCYDQLATLVSFYFVPRPGFEKSPFAAISSTELRKNLEKGESLDRWLEYRVEQDILKNNPYAKN